MKIVRSTLAVLALVLVAACGATPTAPDTQAEMGLAGSGQSIAPYYGLAGSGQ